MGESAKPKGLHCPRCRGVRLTVVTSNRPAPGIKIRYRKCSACGCRITTKEVIVRWQYQISQS